MALQDKQCRVITIEATEKPRDIKLRVRQRTEKILKHELDDCPICRRKRREYAKLSRPEKCQVQTELLAKIITLSESIESGRFWSSEDKMPAQTSYFYYYPNGKNGDINDYLAKKYGSVESFGVLQKAVLTTENHEWFDGLQTGVTRIFSQRDLHVLKQQNSDYTCFLSTYHLPTILQNTLNECYMCEIPIPIDLLKASDSALKKWRTLKRALRKELYENLVLEG